MLLALLPLEALPPTLCLSMILAALGGRRRTIRVAAALLANWLVLAGLQRYTAVDLDPTMNMLIDGITALVIGIEVPAALLLPTRCSWATRSMTCLQGIMLCSYALEIDFHAMDLLTGEASWNRMVYWMRLYDVAWFQAMLILGWSLYDAGRLAVARIVRPRDHVAHLADQPHDGAGADRVRAFAMAVARWLLDRRRQGRPLA